MSGLKGEVEEGEIIDSDITEEKNPPEIKKQPMQHYSLFSNPRVTSTTSRNMISWSRRGGSDNSYSDHFSDDKGIKKTKFKAGRMDFKSSETFVNPSFVNNGGKMPPMPKESKRATWSSWNRGVEMYSHAKEDDRPFLVNKVKPGEVDLFREVTDLEKVSFNQMESRKRKSVFERLGKRPSVKDRLYLPIVTVNSSVEDVTRYISNKLQKTKLNLMRRIVQVIGKAKALDLLKETEEVEAKDGMMIKNGCRRHTTGGVYIHLLTRKRGLSKEQLKYIFNVGGPWRWNLKKCMPEKEYNYKGQTLRVSLIAAGRGNGNKTIPMEMSRVVSIVAAEDNNSSQSSVKGETGSTTNRDKHHSDTEEGFDLVEKDRGKSNSEEGKWEKSEPDNFSQLDHVVKPQASQEAKEKPAAGDSDNANAFNMDDVLDFDVDEDFMDLLKDTDDSDDF